MSSCSPPPSVASRNPQYGECLFDEWVDAKRKAASSENLADHKAVVDAYNRFMRAHLGSDERRLLNLEDEVAALTTENRELRVRLAGGRK